MVVQITYTLPSAQQPAQVCDGQAGTLEAHAMFSWATAINNSKTIPICNMSRDFCNVNFIKIRTFLLLVVPGTMLSFQYKNDEDFNCFPTIMFPIPKIIPMTLLLLRQISVGGNV